MLENRETLSTADKSVTIVLDPLGGGKIKVISTWDKEIMILADQVLEAVALGKSLRIIRAPRPLEYLDYDPLGFADAGYGRGQMK
jgi:hypothetical protein